MANNCNYAMRAVAGNPKVLDRLGEILDYKDPVYYLYRVFSVWNDDPVRDKESGLWTLDLDGDVAWACYHWIMDEDDPSEVFDETGATYHSLVSICHELGIALEIWSEEYGVGFQEHIIIGHSGSVLMDCEDAEYIPYEERTDEDVDYKGGFDNYCEFMSAQDIWNFKN